MRWVWLVALTACVPQVASNGHFACGASGECPRAAPFCHADGRCYAGPEADGGGNDATRDGGPDAPDPVPPRCFAPMFACALGDACIHEVDATEGYCAPPSTGPCPDGGPAASDGFCRAPCTSDASCFGSDCTFGRWTGDTISGACVEARIARPDGFAARCTTDSACPRPLQCIAGHCGRRCDGTSDRLRCAAGEMCGPHPTGVFLCHVTCAAGEVCPTGTACDDPGGGLVCLPPGPA